MRRWRRSIGGALLAALLAATSGGGGEQRCGHLHAARAAAEDFDAYGGRDARVYPRSPRVDYRHLKLDLRFDDLKSRRFGAVQTIDFETLALPIESLELDGVDLDLRFVRRADGLDLDYHYDRRRLRVRFEPPLPPRSAQTLTIGYSCDQPTGGIIFALPDEGYPDRPLHIHTQGQPELNRHWFFAHDHPNTRCTTEVIAAVPSGYQVLANGKQLAVEELPGGLTRWHYRLDQPHPTYLVSLVIGEFEIVREEWRGRPVEYWVPPGGSGDAPRTFGKTPRMMELFSTLLDSPYPYDKYAQSVVYLFQWGGMENTSATTLYESVLVSQRAALDEDAEDLIVHELAHQWFGDMVTCRSWDHLWLNEGFATYFEHVWNENEYGPDAYEYGVWRLLRGVAEADLDGDVGLSAPFSGDPDDLFGRSQSNPYSKGAAVIHALRRELGDEAFWACVREYLKEFSWREVESDDLRRVCERVTGLSLERFWTQWVRRGGAPRIKVFTDWNPDRGTLTIDLEQTQKINADAPAFAADLDVWLVHADGTVERRKTPIERRFESLAIECREEPLQVCIDPRAALPAIWDLGLLDHEMLLRIVTDGPTIHSRLTAMHALAQVDRPRVREVLSRLLGNERAFWGLRFEAAAVLGKMNLRTARDKLLTALHDGLADLRVKRAVVEALGGYRHQTVAEALLGVLRSGKSDRLMAAACDALARQASDPRIVAALRAAADHDSRDDRVRRSAVRALARLGAPEGVAPARELARYGAPYRSRATGVAALGKLGHLAENTGEIRQFLIDLLDDPQDLAAGAAPGALVELGDPNAVAALERFAGGAAPRALRDAARDAAESLSRPDRDADTIRALRRELDDLKQRVRELEQSESD